MTWGPLKMEAHTLPCRNMDLYDVVTSSYLKTKAEGYILPGQDMDSCHVATLSQENTKNESHHSHVATWTAIMSQHHASEDQDLKPSCCHVGMS